MTPGSQHGGEHESTAGTLVPPRFWWLERIGRTIIALSILVILLHLGLLVVTKHRVDDLIKTYHEQGQPVHRHEVDAIEAASAVRHASALYVQANLYLPKSLPAGVHEDSLRNPDMVRSRPDLAAQLVSTNGDALALMRRARATGPRAGGAEASLSGPPMGQGATTNLLSLIKLASISVMHDHFQGNDFECLEKSLDGLHHAYVLGVESRSTIPHLYSMSAQCILVEAIEAIAPRLRVAGEMEAQHSASPASRQKVNEVIEALLTEGPLRESCRQMIWSERALCVDTMIGLDDGTITLSAALGIPGGGTSPFADVAVVRRVFRPMWRADLADGLRRFTKIAEAYEQERYPATVAAVAAQGEEERSWLTMVYPSRYISPFFARHTMLYYRAIAFRRMAAIALAIRLYEIDEGERPETLEQLVPQYLAAIPADPFAREERLIGYLPNAEPPVLYSVGIDGIDDGGEFKTWGRGGVNTEVKDLVFFLDGDRPVVPRWRPKQAPTAPASQPVAEDPPDPS